MSEQEEDAHFAAGLHNQILTQLQKIGSLGVISSTSVQEYRDSPKNLRTIGRELGARYIGEGAVWRAGDSVRIDFQLIDAETDAHVWADSYDRELSSSGAVFSVTTEIARSVASSLQAAITPEQEKVLQQPQTDNSDAYDRYLRGVGRLEALRTLVDVEAGRLFREAIDLFQAAVRLDPGFGQAHAKLALAHLSLWWYGHDNTETRAELARQSLDQALALSPELGETQHSLGLYRYWVDRDHEGALDAFEEARRRLPGDSDPDEFIGLVMRRQGRFLESARIHEEVFTLNPRNATLASEMSLTYGSIRENDKSVEWAERAIDLGSGSASYWAAALAYLRLGNLDEARALLSKAPDPSSAQVIDAGFWVEVYARDYDAAASWLAKAPGRILEMQRNRYPVAGYWGRLHRWAERPEQAELAFRQAVTEYRARGQGGGGLAVALAGLGKRDAA